MSRISECQTVCLYVFLVLSAIAVINKCIEAGDASATWRALMQDNALLSGLDEDSVQKYQNCLSKALKNKVSFLFCFKDITCWNYGKYKVCKNVK